MTMGSGGDDIEPSKLTIEQSKIARQWWNEYKSRYGPIERDQIVNASRELTPAAKERERGSFVAEIMSKAPKGQGINPNNAASVDSARKAADTTASAVGAGKVAADDAQEKKFYGIGIDSMRLGRDLQASGLSNLSRRGSYKNAENIAEAYSDQMREQAKGEAIGTLVGYGVGRATSGRRDVTAGGETTYDVAPGINDVDQGGSFGLSDFNQF